MTRYGTYDCLGEKATSEIIEFEEVIERNKKRKKEAKKLLERTEKTQQVKKNATSRIFEKRQGGKPASFDGGNKA